MFRFVVSTVRLAHDERGLQLPLWSSNGRPLPRRHPALARNPLKQRAYSSQ